ncbi:dihydrofolate reductase family protein [Rhabdobacter roseus]|uniref:Dihydrofolate reductase n=1 Tax=Rhabdobacter roseus TaxID=1655419 RepID=A0A840TQ87_9BACT|nr:dihydrofolate reductase family protein [Rhabdobacter roseus]MBB5283403.1 dihydrofolate reductase [Rhabdobacter roseus]
MRKLKLQMQISLDGFVAGPNGEMDWLVWNWDDALNQYVTDLTEPVETIVLGRKLAEGFIPAWKAQIDEPGGRKMVETPKIVFSKSLSPTDPAVADWEYATLNSGDLAQEITRLKQQPGGDIIAYGGAEFVSELIRLNLIDEYHLLVNPTGLGQGMAIFRHRADLRLQHAQAFSCGITALCYVPSKT